MRKVLILPDIHVPYQDDKTLKAVEHYMEDETWDEVIWLGDLMDFDTISKFNADLLRNLETRRIMRDYEIARELISNHQYIVKKNNPDAKFVLLEGNHEYRMEYFLDKAPQFEGLLEVEPNLQLKEKGIKWVRSWSRGEEYKVGKIYFIHGTYINKYHAAKTVENYGVNVVYGHTHDMMSYPKAVRGKSKVIKAWSLGCLCGEMKYMRGKPNNWSQGFGVAYIEDSGMFNLYPVDIFNHQFRAPNGKLYKP